jgi:hypothetical protein
VYIVEYSTGDVRPMLFPFEGRKILARATVTEGEGLE